MPEDFVSKPLTDCIFSLLKPGAMRTAALRHRAFSTKTARFPTGFSTHMVEKEKRSCV
jgi:hypothetical protein